jgi:hypothetical protein
MPKSAILAMGKSEENIVKEVLNKKERKKTAHKVEKKSQIVQILKRSPKPEKGDAETLKRSPESERLEKVMLKSVRKRI